MRARIDKETIIIIAAVIVAIAALTGVAYLIINDGSPRVKLVPVSSEQVVTQPSSEVSLIPEIEGEWFRTGVSQEEPATIEISTVTETSFQFQLHARNLTKSGSIGGEAYFQQEYSEATFINEDTGASIIFSFSDYTITISHTSTDTALGCDDTVTYDGTYSMDTPVYTDVSSQEDSSNESSSESSSSQSSEEFSKDLRKDNTIINNIKSLMSDSDYNLYRSVMVDENIRESYPETEADTDKNGNKICVDREMNAIKYYAVLNGASTEVLLICKSDGKVYVAIYEVDEVRYYTNDSQYSTSAPKSIVTFAESRPAPLKYM